MRICLTVAYDGTAYAGWQVQPEKATVQGALEAVLQRTTGRKIRVTGASRTDAGVHAEGQVCHFDAPQVDDKSGPTEWLRRFNALLPADIRVLAAASAGADFHARYGASRKTYRYQIDRQSVASPFLAAYAWHCPGLFRLAEMREAAGLLVGDLDQAIFATRPEGDRPIRPIDECSVDSGRLLTVTVSGRSFLRYAVRGMVGALVEVGCNRRSVAAMREMIAGATNHPRAVRAPAHGLCLVRVDYEELACRRLTTADTAKSAC
jgi:tRNA pseudouridine38-40 synthase